MRDKKKNLVLIGVSVVYVGQLVARGCSVGREVSRRRCENFVRKTAIEDIRFAVRSTM